MLQRVLSLIVAVLSLVEWIYLGFVTPMFKTILTDFGFTPTAPDWPHAVVMSFHWGWCLPVGVLVAAGIIVKDRWYARSRAATINLIILLAGVALAMLWMWGAIPPLSQMH